MRVSLVLNERSRRGAQAAGAVRAALHSAGITLVNPGEVCDAVVAAGGDGTVIGAAGRALELQVPLGIIPLGTFNDLARTLGIPLDVEGACALVAAGATRAIDVGRVNGMYFLNEASVGLSTRIARKQTPEIKRRFGFGGIIATALQTLRQSSPFHVEIAFDAQVERFKTIQLTVANSHRFGGWIAVESAAIDDGWLDLYSVETENWYQVFTVVRKIVTHRVESIEGLRVRRSARFAVRTHRPHHVTADGEPAGFTPAVFDILPRALRVLVPR